MATTGGSIAVSSFPSSSSSSFSHKTKALSYSFSVKRPEMVVPVHQVAKLRHPWRSIACSAVQESSTPTVAAEAKEKKDEKTAEKKEAKPAATAAAAAPAKPKRAAKAPAKPLPQMMEEEIIPSLRTTLEAQEDISELELSFSDNKLEGSFLKKGIPYTFWAFFPDGNITGPKAFSLSSYGSGVSTVEPFLVDEKRPTAKLVVFWVEKRLAAQGIIPVWKE